MTEDIQHLALVDFGATSLVAGDQGLMGNKS